MRTQCAIALAILGGVEVYTRNLALEMASRGNPSDRALSGYWFVRTSLLVYFRKR